MSPSVQGLRFDYPNPKFALVEAIDNTGRPGYKIEPFDPACHIHPRWGWARAGVTLFGKRAEVAHLRSEIFN